MALLSARIDPAAAVTRKPRILWLDAARGVGIIAVVVYHAAFDLTFFGYVDWPVGTHPLWRAFAAAAASTFVFLVGVSLVVAHREGIRWRAFLRRLAIIVVAAGAVTVGTMFVMPVPIYFGILHAIATFSVLALPFLRLPVLVTLLVAVVVFALPFVGRSEIFAGAWAYPLGLAPVAPLAFDYEPIFPWFSVTLLGVVVGRLMPVRPPPANPERVWTALAWLGRYSLIIYLVHQPILFAILMSYAALT